MRLLASSPRLLGAAAILLVLLFAALTVRVEQVRRPRPDMPAQIDGTFGEHGALPHGKPAPGGVRYWSSWGGSDDHRGTLVLGPFNAPRRLGLHVSGYPRIGGNAIRVTHLASGETRVQQLENVGETWLPVRLDLPASWHRQPVSITVVDDAAEWGGWIAVSQPFTSPWWAQWTHGFALRLAGLLVVMLTAGILIAATAKLLVSTHRVRLDSAMLLPLAFAGVAVCGYGLFWIGLVSAAAMKLAAWTGLLLATFVTLTPRPRWAVAWRDRSSTDSGPPPGERAVVVADRYLITRIEPGPHAPGELIPPARTEWFWASLTTIIGGLFVFAMLHLFDAERVQSDLARSRFSETQLPSDNTIPQFMADRILKGEPAGAMFGDWHSSDRPPLQTGWILALVEPALSLGIDYDTATQCAGVCFQLLAIPAMWVLLRQLGASRAVAAAVIFAVVPSGFFFINLTFVWPKMVGGAFAVLAFLLWFGPARASGHSNDAPFAAGLFSGLAWLSHGGVAFAFLAVAPLAAMACLRGAWRPWAASAAGFLLLALPWSGYQKFYDPPGNRLVKWHLGGVIPPDDRGTLETLATAYRDRPIDDWIASRRLNLDSITKGSWTDLATFSFPNRQARRSNEFYHTLFALGWWNLGFVALPLALSLRRLPAAAGKLAGRLFLWVAGTIVIWVALIYFGGHTVIHQGSYTTLIVLFPLLAFALWRVHPLAFATVVVAQGVTFAGIWMTPPSGAVGQTMLPVPLAVGGCCSVAALAIACAAAHVAGSSDPATCDPKAA